MAVTGNMANHSGYTASAPLTDPANKEPKYLIKLDNCAKLRFKEYELFRVNWNVIVG